MTVLASVDLPDDENLIKNIRKCRTVGYEQVLYKIRSFGNGTFDIQVRYHWIRQVGIGKLITK